MDWVGSGHRKWTHGQFCCRSRWLQTTDVVRIAVIDVGVEQANRVPAEEHDQVRLELRLQRPASLHAEPRWTGQRVWTPDPRRHLQLPGRPAGRPLPRRNVRLRLQFRRVLEFTATDSRPELTDTDAGHVGCTSGYLGGVHTAALLPCRLGRLCIIDQANDAVLGCSLDSFPCLFVW